MIRRPRALFFGTPDFAVPILHATAAIADIVAVVTQPDQPKGRGQKSAHSAVFSAAESLHIPILTPTRFDDATTKALTALAPDIAVLAAYGNIIPQHVLDIPRKGFINIHPSLLPKYRGAAPIAGAILNDDETTGTTLIVLDDEMDHGPIIAQETLAIEPHEHRPSLEKRCAELGAKLISSALVPYLEGSIEPKAQVHHHAIYTRQLARENAHINWTDDAARIVDVEAGGRFHGRGVRFRVRAGVLAAALDSARGDAPRPASDRRARRQRASGWCTNVNRSQCALYI